MGAARRRFGQHPASAGPGSVIPAGSVRYGSTPGSALSGLRPRGTETLMVPGPGTSRAVVITFKTPLSRQPLQQRRPSHSLILYPVGEVLVLSGGCRGDHDARRLFRSLGQLPLVTRPGSEVGMTPLPLQSGQHPLLPATERLVQLVVEVVSLVVAAPGPACLVSARQRVVFTVARHPVVPGGVVRVSLVVVLLVVAGWLVLPVPVHTDAPVPPAPVTVHELIE